MFLAEQNNEGYSRDKQQFIAQKLVSIAHHSLLLCSVSFERVTWSEGKKSTLMTPISVQLVITSWGLDLQHAALKATCLYVNSMELKTCGAMGTLVSPIS